MPAMTSSKLLPLDDPALDYGEAQHLMQRLLADRINNYATIDELRMLLVSGAQADGVVTDGLTPLHYACHRGYYAAAKLLLVRGAKVNAVDAIGYSALHLCAEKGYYRLLKLLLEYMAHVCYYQQNDKCEFPSRDSADEPLRLALDRGHYECAKVLLEHGADANTKYFMGPEITLVSPLETNFLRLLLSYGADPNVYSRDGLTPLMKACRYRERGIRSIRVLLEYKADINAMARARQECRTPLHYAVLSGSSELIDFLIENGAKVNMPKSYEKPSVLEVAVMKDDPALVKQLLDAGADPNAMHGCFGSALHIALCAEKKFQFEMVQLLLQYGADPNLVGPDADGRLMKSPFVEYMRAKETANRDVNILALLLSYGGKVIGQQSHSDARGQFRNITNLMMSTPDLGIHMLSLIEDVDQSAVSRLLSCDSTPEVAKIAWKEAVREPKSLQQLSRLRIRSLVEPLCPEAVNNLPLPGTLKKYILGYY
uniref:SOCS box domain-containing protein n=1 Tax=Panagrellus redivivus TaxID=6233 RepID=A0A7E4ZXT8_PANRE